MIIDYILCLARSCSVKNAAVLNSKKLVKQLTFLKGHLQNIIYYHNEEFLEKKCAIFKAEQLMMNKKGNGYSEGMNIPGK